MSNDVLDLDLSASSTAGAVDTDVSGAGDTSTDLGFDLSNVPDVVILPAGVYNFKIDGVKSKTSKKDASVKYLEWQLSCVDNPLAEIVFHNMFLPSASDTPKQSARRLRDFKAFVTSTGNVPTQGFCPNDYIGCNIQAEIKVDVFEGRVSNKVAAFVSPA